VRTYPDGDEPESSFDLGSVIANPRATKARLFVVAEVTLAVGPSGVIAEIDSEKNIDRVRDQVVAALGGATPEQLRLLEGRSIVKDDIKSRLNDFLYEGQVMDVYFSAFYFRRTQGISRLNDANSRLSTPRFGHRTYRQRPLSLQWRMGYHSA